MVETLSLTSSIGARDRALLLVGFAGAFRRTELVSLDVADVCPLAPTGWSCSCPVRTLRAWLEIVAIASGPIFRPVDRHANVADSRLTHQSVALLVKRCAKAAGLD